MKKLLYCLLALVLIFGAFPTTAMAAEGEVADLGDEAAVVRQETILQSDGSTLEIRIVESTVKATNYKDGSITYTHRNSSGTIQWEATLNAHFYCNGSISSCTAASLSIQFSNGNYYEVSRSVSKSGNTATADFTIGYKFLGITLRQNDYTLTLSCDKNGNLS